MRYEGGGQQSEVRPQTSYPGSQASILKNIPDKIVVFIKRRKIVVVPASNANKGDKVRVYFLQAFTMGNRYQQVFGAVNYVGVTFHEFDPFVCTQMKT